MLHSVSPRCQGFTVYIKKHRSYFLSVFFYHFWGRRFQMLLPKVVGCHWSLLQSQRTRKAVTGHFQIWEGTKTQSFFNEIGSVLRARERSLL